MVSSIVSMCYHSFILRAARSLKLADDLLHAIYILTVHDPTVSCYRHIWNTMFVRLYIIYLYLYCT